MSARVLDVTRRLHAWQDAHGGEMPSLIVVTPEEGREIVALAYGFSYHSLGLPTPLPCFRGVPIHIGEVSYPWGCFPTEHDAGVA